MVDPSSSNCGFPGLIAELVPCWRVLEQDTEHQIASDAGPAVHRIVCVCVCQTVLLTTPSHTLQCASRWRRCFHDDKMRKEMINLGTPSAAFSPPRGGWNSSDLLLEVELLSVEVKTGHLHLTSSVSSLFPVIPLIHSSDLWCISVRLSFPICFLTSLFKIFSRCLLTLVLLLDKSNIQSDQSSDLICLKEVKGQSILDDHTQIDNLKMSHEKLSSIHLCHHQLLPDAKSQLGIQICLFNRW